MRKVPCTTHERRQQPAPVRIKMRLRFKMPYASPVHLVRFTFCALILFLPDTPSTAAAGAGGDIEDVSTPVLPYCEKDFDTFAQKTEASLKKNAKKSAVSIEGCVSCCNIEWVMSRVLYAAKMPTLAEVAARRIQILETPAQLILERGTLSRAVDRQS